MANRQQALDSINFHAVYRHLGGHRDVVVTDVIRSTGRVHWQQVGGPSLGDCHRHMDVEEFLTVYELKEQR